MHYWLNCEEIDVVIYHHPCSDGFASRYVAEKYLRATQPEKQVIYIPASIGALPPQGLNGKNVLICDYSYRKEILLQLINQVNNLLIIDHHKSAMKDLEGIDDKYKIFDMEKSGSVLTWEYFYPNKELPLMLKYIQDRDIWTKKLPNTDEFSYWFYTLPFEYEIYDKYSNDEMLLNMIDAYGKPFIELNNHYIKEACKHCCVKFQNIKDRYYFIAYVNSTVLKSDIGNKIFEYYKNIDFSVVYNINDSTNSTSFSLRSTDKHSDVSEIAFSLGHGGHRNASGVKVLYVTNQLPGNVYDIGWLYNQISKIYFGYIFLGNETYNIVYLASNVHAVELGTYLLQTKYYDKNGAKVQECCDIVRKNTGLDNSMHCHMACILDYDIISGKTTFSIVYDQFMPFKNKQMVDKYLGCDSRNCLKVNGFHQFLPISKNNGPIKITNI